MNRKGRHGRAAGRVTWAPSTSRPILARGVTTGANLLTPVTSHFSHVPAPTAAPARTTHGNGCLRLTFRHCRHCGDPVFAPTGPRQSRSCMSKRPMPSAADQWW